MSMVLLEKVVIRFQICIFDILNTAFFGKWGQYIML